MIPKSGYRFSEKIMPKQERTACADASGVQAFRCFAAQADNCDSAGSIPASGKRRTRLPVCTRSTLPLRSALSHPRLEIEVDATVAEVAVNALMITGLSSIC